MKECRHKETGHIGKIISKLKDTDSFPDQYGIYWYDGREGNEHAKRNREICTLHYWQDQDKIEILK